MTAAANAGTVTWRRAPARLSFAPDAVHVWYTSLDLPGETIQQMQRTLAPDERARSCRFRFARDRTRYIAAHGALRAMLARYLEIGPEQVPLVCAPGAKPCLAPGGSGPSLQFSLAHAQDSALYAVAIGAAVGIDVELMQPLAEADQIATRFFSGAENVALAGLAPEQRRRAFYTCWTVKEAYSKAIGAGLAYPLNGVEVALPGETLAAIGGRAAEAARWSVHLFQPAAGYRAAVVVERPVARLHFWRAVTHGA